MAERNFVAQRDLGTEPMTKLAANGHYNYFFTFVIKYTDTAHAQYFMHHVSHPFEIMLYKNKTSVKVYVLRINILVFNF